MIPHEIERHQAQPQQIEVVLHLDPSLFWFSGHFAVQPLLPENTVTLTLSWQEARQLLTFSYQRHDGDARHTASSGKIRLCR